MAHLAGFRGFLQADAYAGSDGLYRSGVTQIACWAHFRRKVFDLHERSPTPLTTDILERIGALYAVEAAVRGQPPDVRCRTRQEKSRPLVEALREVLDAALRHLSPRSDMARAIGYRTKRWPALSRFIDDGRLEIDNNIAKRALRGVAVGRCNWLFAGSRAGGERAATIYTVIQTCKANGIDPHRRHRQDRRRLACQPLGRTHAVALVSRTCQTGDMSAETIARLHIVLDDIEPAIWRRVDVPVTASLKMLHDIVQAAMGWKNATCGISRPATDATATPTRCGGKAAWPQPKT